MWTVSSTRIAIRRVPEKTNFHDAAMRCALPRSACIMTRSRQVQPSNVQMLTIVIPYFQRESGILRRALRSVFAQTTSERIHVLIVDDGSPVPASAELAALKADPRFPIKLLKQENSGPGSARNVGLDNAPPETRYIAFLDSDDEWSPDHLANAGFALSTGYDIYFADFYQLGQRTSAFERASRIEPGKHPLLSDSTFLHAYVGDMMDQIITGNIIGTSTVVYDFRKFAGIRFRTDLTHAGEDYLFWLEFAGRSARFCFSAHCEVTYGAGVNVYSKSGWGTDSNIVRIRNEIQYRNAIQELFPLTAAQSKSIKENVRRLRRAFVEDVLHRVAHRKKLTCAALVAQLRVDPLSWVLFLPLAVLISVDHMRRNHRADASA